MYMKRTITKSALHLQKDINLAVYMSTAANAKDQINTSEDIIES